MAKEGPLPFPISSLSLSLSLSDVRATCRCPTMSSSSDLPPPPPPRGTGLGATAASSMRASNGAGGEALSPHKFADKCSGHAYVALERASAFLLSAPFATNDSI